MIATSATSATRLDTASAICASWASIRSSISATWRSTAALVAVARAATCCSAVRDIAWTCRSVAIVSAFMCSSNEAISGAASPSPSCTAVARSSIKPRSAVESDRISSASERIRASTIRSIAAWISCWFLALIPTRSDSMSSCSPTGAIALPTRSATCSARCSSWVGERLGVLLDALREHAHRLGPALDVALHRLADAGGLLGDQLAVVASLDRGRLR